MFYRGYSILVSLARPEALPSPRAPVSLKACAEEGAQRAMCRALSEMPLSERLADPAAYRRLQRARRQTLEALMLVDMDEAALRRAVDVACMLCEESTWSENPSGAPFDDDSHPEIDVQCAETAVLLGWFARAGGDLLSSRVAGKLISEVRRRVFSPFLAHQDYPFMRARGKRPLLILTDILLSAMLLETDAQRRASVMRQALRQIDQGIQTRPERVETLCDAAAETGAITDLAALLRRMTRGELDLTPTYPTPDWLDQLLYPWLEGEYFADPASGDMLPPLSGETLFRIGLAGNDDALTALGAKLHRARRIPSDSVTGRLMDMACQPMLEAESRKMPRIRSGATPLNRVMVSRFGGMTCAMHTGGHRANAGGLLLFSDGRPVLVESGGFCSVPRIGGRDQLDTPDLSCEAEYDLRQDMDTLSVELTTAWPAGLINAYQRTAMVRRQEGALQLVEALDLAEPAPVAFRFITPRRPEYLMDGLRLGGVDMRWAGQLTVRSEPLNRHFPDGDAEGDALYRIELSTPGPVQRALYTFTFSRT